MYLLKWDLAALQSPCRAPCSFCRSGSGFRRGQGVHLSKTGCNICVIKTVYTQLEIWPVPYKGSDLALRLLQTVRDQALAWHSAECWASYLQRFSPCPEAATKNHRPGADRHSAECWASTLHRFCPCPEAVTLSHGPGVSLALCCMLDQYLT